MAAPGAIKMAEGTREKPLPLRLEQMAASDPTGHVWLSASAGTGKTFVLAARVLRLLLRGTDPENILCLTFTRAGAAEMANRIHDRLASWVQMDENRLFDELDALGEDAGPDARDHARTLFARVLESTGGGLRIQTIHSFCQQLLATFPVEAGLVPGFRPLDEREQALLARETLAAVLQDAADRDDRTLIEAVQMLSIRLGEQEAESYLLASARDVEALSRLPDDIAAWLFEGLGLGDGDVESMIAAGCADDMFDVASLRWIAAQNAEWKSARGQERAAICHAWLAASADERAASLKELHGVWAKADGDPRSFGKGQAPAVDGYAEYAMRLYERCALLLELRDRAAYARFAAAALHGARAYAIAYHEAKRAAGAVDFEDLIARTVRLLSVSNMAQWIGYKLDQITDHVLVDEAQDTNRDQWDIVDVLVAEYFAGLGSKDGKLRTLFAVGDYKQAIYSFQGTSPQAFRDARDRFMARVLEARANDPDNAEIRDIREVSLDRSFRSTPAVLDVVDRLIADLGGAALGLEEGAVRHDSERRHPGEVMLWTPLAAQGNDMADDEDGGEEGWAADHVRDHAAAIARQIRVWLDDGLYLSAQGRRARAGDIMILVRTRGELARLLVARLYEEGVAVAGIDRLRLDAPLAVRDLLAALRFALQPDDDLNLAALLVSPLMAWTQDDLMHKAPRPKVSLWRHLRAAHADDPAVAALADLLGGADFTTPYRYLEQLLSGPLQGRRKLLGRLGEEARDHIDELLNQALAFEQSGAPSLQRFVDWFDRGDVDVKREAAEQGGAVRVLTVHGAKGLQAPIVILADATADPDAGNRREWTRADLGSGLLSLPPQSSKKMFGLIGDEQARAKAESERERWRLLYVALTRAEEKLVICGALGPKTKGRVPEKSWYAAVERAMIGLGAERRETPIWGSARIWSGPPGLPERAAKKAAEEGTTDEAPPAWLWEAAPQEQRPPRPLAPSAAIEDESADPPPSAAMRAAAERGRCLHALFERLPALPSAERRAAADRWLSRQGAMADDADRADIIDAALRVIDDPRFAAIFSPDALAEAPVVAVVGDQVIAGTVDRLCIGLDRVMVVDFKTGRRAPRDIGEVPTAHVRQMAAYVAALEVVFPGRRVTAGLLYTAAPRLIELGEGDLQPHKPGFIAAQHNL